jgi:hypothetical protein
MCTTRTYKKCQQRELLRKLGIKLVVLKAITGAITPPRHPSFKNSNQELVNTTMTSAERLRGPLGSLHSLSALSHFAPQQQQQKELGRHAVLKFSQPATFFSRREETFASKRKKMR